MLVTTGAHIFLPQMSKPDEHLFFRWANKMNTFFQMNKPDEHYFSDVQGEMSTFLSDEQVKMSTLYFQMSTFYLWDEHLSTLCQSPIWCRVAAEITGRNTDYIMLMLFRMTDFFDFFLWFIIKEIYLIKFKWIKCCPLPYQMLPVTLMSPFGIQC